MLQEFDETQVAAFGDDLCQQNIGLDHQFACRRRRCRDRRCRHARYCARHSRYLQGNRRLRYAGVACRRLPDRSDGRLGMLFLPSVPQHHQGKRKNEKQDQAAGIHGTRFRSVVPPTQLRRQRIGERCFQVRWRGTGSNPPGCQGWQRHSRWVLSQAPCAMPCSLIASAAYSEQLGSNRQCRPSIGLMA